MTSAIPVVDLEAGAASQLDLIRAGTEELGAIQVVGHGVPRDLMSDLNRRMARLLSLPREQKAQLASPHPYRGWRQWPDDSGRLELERFNVAQFDAVADASAAGVPAEYLGLYAHGNRWPEDDPGLRETAFGYMAACRRLALRMLGWYARAQGLPSETFVMGSVPHFRLTVNDYPTWAYPSSDPGDKLLLLEHADDSAVTILAQQGDYEGLQVQGPDGDWNTVPIIPGALLVLSGHLLTAWTGGRLRPGRHRVLAGGTATRRSTAVFVYPSLEVVVEPLGAFAPFAAGPGFPPVQVWDHVRDRVAGYLAEYGRPEQVAAWRDGTPYVAELAEDSAGRLRPVRQRPGRPARTPGRQAAGQR
ncbi:MAG TPA: 2OG-Fe(II) oxygenase family protein [Streptosporangiaceae bacterium]|nr:2OG-Fe(II) oxygenase family protein [Streptosporangiaceae bacterium]